MRIALTKRSSGLRISRPLLGAMLLSCLSAAMAQSSPQARDESAAPDFSDVQAEAATPPVEQPATDADTDADASAQSVPAAPSAPTPEPIDTAAASAEQPAGDSTLRAQILLERARFSTGEIDGQGGSNTRRAIAAFQDSNGIADSGELDAATWEALNRDDAPVLVDYTITDADAAGPFSKIPADMMEKSKLETLGYASLAEALGERFHSSPKLLASLNAGKTFAAGTTIAVPNVGALPALSKADKVVVDKSDASVSLVDGEGKVYARYPASSGSVHDPLPIGDWKINGVARNPDFKYNPKLFWDADPKHAKATIPPGPNNPVGVVWIDLSKDHYGIHGTPEPSKIGKTESHGCIRLTNWSAMEVAAAVSPGMQAVLQE